MRDIGNFKGTIHPAAYKASRLLKNRLIRSTGGATPTLVHIAAYGFLIFFSEQIAQAESEGKKELYWLIEDSPENEICKICVESDVNPKFLPLGEGIHLFFADDRAGALFFKPTKVVAQA